MCERGGSVLNPTGLEKKKRQEARPTERSKHFIGGERKRGRREQKKELIRK